jgi:hypothetical protein
MRDQQSKRRALLKHRCSARIIEVTRAQEQVKLRLILPRQGSLSQGTLTTGSGGDGRIASAAGVPRLGCNLAKLARLARTRNKPTNLAEMCR